MGARALAKAIASALARQLGGVGAGGPAWTPALLFQSGEQGVWYDPSDFSTMFQDAAGTTPVTAVEQPVGLALDKRLGLVRGIERGWGQELALSDFIANAEYTLTDLGDRIRITRATTNATTGLVLDSKLAVVAGAFHEVKFSILAISAGASGFYAATNGGAAQAISNFYPGAPSSFTHIVKLDGSGNGKLRLSFGPARSASPSNALVGDYIELSKTISVRELPGNHAFQTTTAQKPVLSARKNLLTNTEEFSAWTQEAVTSVRISGAEWKISPTAATAIHGVKIVPAGARIGGTIFVAEVKADGYSKVSIGETNQTGTHASFDLSSGTKMVGSALSQIVPLPNGWYRIFVRPFGFDDHTGVGGWCIRPLDDAATASTNPNLYSYMGDPTKGIRVRYPQLVAVPTSQSVTTAPSPSYQRVNTATDYDTVGFPHYLKFDGVDDNLATGNINFTATDKMTVVAGATKLSDAAIGYVVDHNSPQANPNAFALTAPQTATTASMAFRTRGSGAPADAVYSSAAAPLTAVLTGIGGISSYVSKLRFNGVEVANSSSDQGVGNYSNAQLYIGKRPSGNHLNGNIYQLIVRGAATADLTDAEAFTAGKTGVTL